jgi:hypothetical protein
MTQIREFSQTETTDMNEAEFIYDLGKIIRKSELGNRFAQARLELIRSSAAAQNAIEHFEKDCQLAKEFYACNAGIQFRALVEDWSRLRIEGELSRRKQNELEICS